MACFRAFSSLLASIALLSGCAAVATGEFAASKNTVHTPERFRTVLEGRYRKAAQADMVDCVNDAMTSPMENILGAHVRQTRRADEVRVDLIAAGSQFLVARVQDDGHFRLDRSDYAGTVRFDRELSALAACLERFRAG